MRPGKDAGDGTKMHSGGIECVRPPASWNIGKTRLADNRFFEIGYEKIEDRALNTAPRRPSPLPTLSHTLSLLFNFFFGIQYLELPCSQEP